MCSDPEPVTGTGYDGLQGMEGVGTQGRLITAHLPSAECSGEGHQQSSNEGFLERKTLGWLVKECRGPEVSSALPQTPRQPLSPM